MRHVIAIVLALALAGCTAHLDRVQMVGIDKTVIVPVEIHVYVIAPVDVGVDAAIGSLKPLLDVVAQEVGNGTAETRDKN